MKHNYFGFKVKFFIENKFFSRYPITIEPVDEPDEEDPWVPVDTLMVALLVGLLAALLVLIGAIVVHKVRYHHMKRCEAFRKKIYSKI